MLICKLLLHPIPSRVSELLSVHQKECQKTFRKVDRLIDWYPFRELVCMA